jgi:hypothetical protein
MPARIPSSGYAQTIKGQILGRKRVLFACKCSGRFINISLTTFAPLPSSGDTKIGMALAMTLS